jgi:hypothetical protein
MQTRKNFIKNNSGFICKNCKQKVQKHPSSSRNHCTKCLNSLHIDEFIPGDRKSTCFGLMQPIFINMKHQNFIITHRCEKCGKISHNITASDDSIEEITKLLQASNLIANVQLTIN